MTGLRCHGVTSAAGDMRRRVEKGSEDRWQTW